MSTLPVLRLPIDIKWVTIFDTNAYREFTFDQTQQDSRLRAERLWQLELARQGIALASPIVIWELISHLADAADPAYANCMNAVVALGEHTRLPSTQGGGITLGLDSEWVVCDALFGVAPAAAEKNVQALSQLATYIRDHAPHITDATAVSNLRIFAAEMSARETAWLAGMQKTLDEVNSPQSSHGDPKTTGKQRRAEIRKAIGSGAFEYLWALMSVLNFAELANVPINKATLQSGIDILRRDFSVPFHLILTLLRNLIGQADLNLTSPKRKRGNFMWDAGLSYVIPALATSVPTATVKVVTGDKAIISAAQAAGAAQVIVPLDEYLREVGFGN